MPRSFSVCLLSVALPACLLISTACRAQESASSSVQAALNRGDALSKQQDYEHALEAYRQAAASAGQACADCFMRIANAELMLGDLEAAVKDFGEAARASQDDRDLAAEAHTVRGQVLSAMSGDPSDPKLKQAEEEFRTALSLSPKKSQARFYLAMLLLDENRDSDGVSELKAYLAGPFVDPKYADRAKRLIADPSRARLPQSDDFSFTTLEGDKISRDGLRGDVVLLDFWGSWCPPCRMSVPMLADLHERFAGKSFRLVGISSDDSERTWREFIADHHMNWPEYIDLDGRMQAIFEISAFPTFVVLDREGGIQFRQSGLGGNTQNELEAAIRGALLKPFSGEVAASSGSAPSRTTSAVAQPAPPAAATDAEIDAARWQAALVPLGTIAGLTPPSASGSPAAADGGKFAYPPDDVENGDADKGVYRNEFLRLFYRPPQSWTPDTPDQLDQANAATRAWLTDHASEESGAIPFPKIIFEAKLEPRAKAPLIRITVRPAQSLTLETAASEADHLKSGYGLALTSSPQQVRIGSRSFIRTDFQLPQADPPLWITSIETDVQQCRVTLEIYARSKEQLDSLIASAQSLTISKP